MLPVSRRLPASAEVSTTLRLAVEFDLPWGSWYADTRHRLYAPNSFDLDVLSCVDAPALTAADIERSLATPLDSPGLSTLASGAATACIAVDDLSRPTRLADVLPTLLSQLATGGVDSKNTTLVVATGTHPEINREKLHDKLGSDFFTTGCRLEVHDCNKDVAPTGILYGDEDLRINRTFLTADVKIGVGCVLPHSFAGYSGGAKIMLPGLASLNATARSHKFVQMGLRGGRDPNENRFRLEAEAHARTVGYSYTVAVVPNSRRQTAAVFAGDLTVAHRAAYEFARATYRTPLSRDYDCLLLNAYPKDTDLIQADAVMVALKTARAAVVKADGVVVLATAASEGLGQHGLFAPGGKSYRDPNLKRSRNQREQWLYCPSVRASDAHKMYPRQTRVFNTPDALLAALEERFPSGATMGVLPTAPMQQVDDLRPSLNQVPASS